LSHGGERNGRGEPSTKGCCNIHVASLQVQIHSRVPLHPICTHCSCPNHQQSLLPLAATVRSYLPVRRRLGFILPRARAGLRVVLAVPRADRAIGRRPSRAGPWHQFPSVSALSCRSSPRKRGPSNSNRSNGCLDYRLRRNERDRCSDRSNQAATPAKKSSMCRRRSAVISLLRPRQERGREARDLAKRAGTQGRRQSPQFTSAAHRDR
jgi:hypothetical protein